MDILKRGARGRIRGKTESFFLIRRAENLELKRN
jgi:hypothetical protein